MKKRDLAREQARLKRLTKREGFADKWRRINLDLNEACVGKPDFIFARNDTGMSHVILEVKSGHLIATEGLAEQEYLKLLLERDGENSIFQAGYRDGRSDSSAFGTILRDATLSNLRQEYERPLEAQPPRLPAEPPLTIRRLSGLVDLVPLPKSRKLLKRILADDEKDIAKLEKEGRPFAARWRAWTSWFYVFWYFFGSLITSVASGVIGRLMR